MTEAYFQLLQIHNILNIGSNVEEYYNIKCKYQVLKTIFDKNISFKCISLNKSEN